MQVLCSLAWFRLQYRIGYLFGVRKVLWRNSMKHIIAWNVILFNTRMWFNDTTHMHTHARTHARTHTHHTPHTHTLEIVTLLHHSVNYKNYTSIIWFSKTHNSKWCMARNKLSVATHQTTNTLGGTIIVCCLFICTASKTDAHCLIWWQWAASPISFMATSLRHWDNHVIVVVLAMQPLVVWMNNEIISSRTVSIPEINSWGQCFTGYVVTYHTLQYRE